MSQPIVTQHGAYADQAALDAENARATHPAARRDQDVADESDVEPREDDETEQHVDEGEQPAPVRVVRHSDGGDARLDADDDGVHLDAPDARLDALQRRTDDLREQMINERRYAWCRTDAERELAQKRDAVDRQARADAVTFGTAHRRR